MLDSFNMNILPSRFSSKFRKGKDNFVYPQRYCMFYFLLTEPKIVQPPSGKEGVVNSNTVFKQTMLQLSNNN